VAEPLILPDSSVWIEANRTGAPADLQGRTKQLLREKRLAIAPPIRLEVLCGARVFSVYEELQGFFDALTDLPVNEEVWGRAYALGFHARRKGLPKLAPDILIAAIALTHHVPLWHCDRDFEQLRQVEPALMTYWHPHQSP